MIDVRPGQSVQAALARGPGAVRLLPGVHAGPVDLTSHVALVGEGPASILRSTAGRPVVRLLPSPDGRAANAQACTVRDLTVDGGRTATVGIEAVSNPLHAAADRDDGFDMRHLIQHVTVQNVAGDGLVLDGRGESRLDDVQVAYVQGVGFRLAAQDLFVSNCTSGQSARAGFVIVRTGSVQVVNAKAFYAGRLIDGGWTSANVPSPGFHLDGCNGVTLNGCVAQDNSGQGFFLENTNRSVVAGLVADSNSKAGVGAFAGVQVWNGEGLDVSGVAFDRRADDGPVTQTVGLRVDGPGVNRIVVVG